MTQDPLVIFTPSGKRGRFAMGTPILTAARQLGVDLDSVCGGRGICSKCQIAPSYGDFPKHGVTVHDGALSEWNAVEDRYQRVRGLKPGRRLGCQATVQGDIVVDVPPESQVHRQVVRKAASARHITMDPATRLVLVEVVEPDMHEPSGDFERLQDALRDQWQISGVTAPLSILQQLQPALRKGNWQVSVALHQPANSQEFQIVGIWPGLHEGGLYGLAIDLGSTTIAAHLCDLSDGRVLASSGLMNPQIRFGEDLMSRVSYVMMNPGGDREMTEAVQQAIANLAVEIAAEAGIDPGLIFETVIVCNPVMHHLLLGIDPVELGQAPFALATSGSMTLPARELGLTTIAPTAQVYLLPCIAGHVGADAAAVALSEEPDQAEVLTLIVDVGNGLGFTSAALCGLSPKAQVIGTNMPGSTQYRIARLLADAYGFTMVPDAAEIAGQPDLVWATEYFEHFDRPLDHANELVAALQPRAMLIANTFGGDATGHFDTYIVDGEELPCGKVGRLFNANLRRLGYRKVGTKMWNARPTLWELEQ